MNSCFPINSLFVFDRIVELLTFNVVLDLVPNNFLIELDMVSIVEDRRRFRDYDYHEDGEN